MKFDPRIVSIPRETLERYHPRVVIQHMPTRAEIKEKFSGASGFTLACWIISSLCAIIIPVSKWTRERNQYYQYMGRYHEYEWKQRQYEQMQNGNGMYNNMSSMCSWWNYKCRQRVARYQYYMQAQQGGQNNQNGQGNIAAMLPGWYTFFGGTVQTEGEGREAEMNMNSSSNGAMKFVYSWNIIMFIGVSIFGYRTLANGKDRTGLIVALLIYAQFSLMNLMCLTQGSIETDNRFLENSIYGWFGQWSVLVAYTDFWMFLHSTIFAFVLGMIQLYNRNQTEEVKNVADEDLYVQEGSVGTSYIQPEEVQREDADYVHA
ncbi:hypothetical protein ACHAWO_008986 [Cyclotella atomus]|uniref:Uncharacterized protein n=1 Tax=Cyclotella atomus TaxID=382360 RepID=A0ABD3Q7H0_9STRA